MAFIFVRRPSGSFFHTQPSAVTLGHFDGVHQGHQALFTRLKTIASEHGLRSVCLTFEPYPRTLLYPDRPFSRLTTLREKLSILKKTGIDCVYALPFNAEIAKWTPVFFIEHFLKNILNTAYFLIGEDFKFGHARQGDINFLKQQPFFPVEIFPPVEYHHQKISSGWVRDCLKNNDFKMAEKLLGQPYALTGRVIKGQQQGRQLGFPTANINLSRRTLALTGGVYAVKVFYKNTYFYGIANVGIRPTVTSSLKMTQPAVLLEVYMFNFNQQIYSESIKIFFYKKIRDEKKFESLKALQLQIQKDIEEVKNYFK